MVLVEYLPFLLTVNKTKQLWFKEGGAYEPQKEEPADGSYSNRLIRRPFLDHLFLKTTTNVPQGTAHDMRERVCVCVPISN